MEFIQNLNSVVQQTTKKCTSCNIPKLKTHTFVIVKETNNNKTVCLQNLTTCGLINQKES